MWKMKRQGKGLRPGTRGICHVPRDTCRRVVASKLVVYRAPVHIVQSSGFWGSGFRV
jgi:hypothetical protein